MKLFDTYAAGHTPVGLYTGISFDVIMHNALSIHAALFIPVCSMPVISLHYVKYNFNPIIPVTKTLNHNRILQNYLSHSVCFIDKFSLNTKEFFCSLTVLLLFVDFSVISIDLC